MHICVTLKSIISIYLIIYPMMAAVKKVTAGTKLDMALAIDDDAMYNPSKYIV